MRGFATILALSMAVEVCPRSIADSTPACSSWADGNGACGCGPVYLATLPPDERSGLVLTGVQLWNGDGSVYERAVASMVDSLSQSAAERQARTKHGSAHLRQGCVDSGGNRLGRRADVAEHCSRVP